MVENLQAVAIQATTCFLSIASEHLSSKPWIDRQALKWENEASKEGYRDREKEEKQTMMKEES